MLEFSFRWTERREGQSEKEKGESLGSKRVLGTGWQIGQIPGKKAAKLCGGSQTKVVKQQGKKSLGLSAEGPKSPPQSCRFCIPLGARCHGKLLFVVVESCSFYLSLGLGTGAEPIAQQVQRGERRVISPVVKASVCHYILKMWCSDSQTEGSWTQ